MAFSDELLTDSALFIIDEVTNSGIYERGGLL
jgi:hypothetical protein